MEIRAKPNIELAKKKLPKSLFRAIQYIAEKEIAGCAIVGGTALSGFYTGHRRSDDLDFFTQNELAQKATILAVKSLKKNGFQFSNERSSAYYFHVNSSSENHFFTIDVVQDENLFKVGKFYSLEQKLLIPDLETILKMKAAALVSRCSEKDLSDLVILFDIFQSITIKQFLELGHQIDSGVHAESMLASLGGTTLRKEACDFSLNKNVSKEYIYKSITQFRTRMIRGLQGFLREQKNPPLGELIQLAKKVLR